MAREQELAVLRERTRLAREMHDTPGHALVLISIKLEAAQLAHSRPVALRIGIGGDQEDCAREHKGTARLGR